MKLFGLTLAGLGFAQFVNGQISVTTASVPTAAFPRVEASGDLRVVLEVADHFDVLTNATKGKQESECEFFEFDSGNKRLWVVNTPYEKIDVYNVNATGHISFFKDLAINGAPNSVAYNRRDGVFAIAVASSTNSGTDQGKIIFADADTVTEIGSVNTQNPLPDHVSFGPGDTCVYSANEGQIASASNNPAGGVTQVCSTDFSNTGTYVTAHSDFNNLDETALNSALAQGGHNPHTGSDAAKFNIEPEYITYGKPDQTGKYEVYVGMQEANMIFVYEGNTNGNTGLSAQPIRIMPLGYKNHGLEGNGLDIADSGSSIDINIRTYKGLFGMYQPDTIKFIEQANAGYIVTANEGDQAEEEEDDVDIADLTFLPGTMEDPLPSELGDLSVTGSSTGVVNATSGERNGAYAFGARSFSVFNAQTGALVYDSGDQFEQMVAKYHPLAFGSTDDKFGESRSNNKGPEPESLAYGTVNGTDLLFVGLERTGVIATYNISDIAAPQFHSLSTVVDCATKTKKLADPEAMHFIPAADSPTGEDLLIVSGSVSSTLTTFRIKTVNVTANPDALMLCDTVSPTANPTVAPTPQSSAQSTTIAVFLSMVLAVVFYL